MRTRNLLLIPFATTLALGILPRPHHEPRVTHIVLLNPDPKPKPKLTCLQLHPDAPPLCVPNITMNQGDQ